MIRKMPAWMAALTMAGAFAADQATKHLVEMKLEPYSSIPVLSGFSLVHIHNRGVSFGLLSSNSFYAPYILALFGLVVSVALAVWAFRSESLLQRGALALIVGGAASNVLDRLDDGTVTDVLDFYIGALHWPAFNLADVVIVCGVGTLLLESLFPAAFETKEPAQ